LGELYASAVDSHWSIISIYDGFRPYDVIGNQHPPATDVLGFFYPETVVVPAAGLTADQNERLINLGRFVAGRGFTKFLLDGPCANWTATLHAAGVPNAAKVGPNFTNFLTELSCPVRQISDADRATRPVGPSFSSWILNLYQEGQA